MLPNTFFSEYFKIGADILEAENALNICMSRDNRLFVDPFQIYHNYRGLHDKIVKYLLALKEKSSYCVQDSVSLQKYYKKSEIIQNWLGYSKTGNKGRGFGIDCAMKLDEALRTYMSDIDVQDAHFEKFSLFNEGVSHDTISDFITNLIIDWLAEFTENIVLKYNIQPTLQKNISFLDENLNRVSKVFTLPFYENENDYIILTPLDMIKIDSMHISYDSFYKNFHKLPAILDTVISRKEINELYKNDLQKLKNNTLDFITHELDTETVEIERKKKVSKYLKSNPALSNLFIEFKVADYKESIQDNIKTQEYIKTIYYPTIDKISDFIRSEINLENLDNTYTIAKKVALTLKKIIINKDENIISKFPKEEIFEIFEICTLGINCNADIKLAQKKDKQAIKLSRNNDETFLELKRALRLGFDINTSSFVFSAETAKFNGVISVLSFSEKEYNNAIKHLNSIGLTQSEYEKIIFINTFTEKNPLPKIYFNQSSKPPSLFISYSHKDKAKKKDLEDRLSSLMKRDKVTIVSDTTLEFRDNIDLFMKTIRIHDFSIMLISQNYLLSQPCLIEFIEAMKNQNWERRILPIMLPNLDVYEDDSIPKYTRLWEAKYLKIEESLKEISEETRKIELLENLKKTRQICDNIGFVIKTLKTLNNIALDNLIQQDYKVLVDYIRNNVDAFTIGD